MKTKPKSAAGKALDMMVKQMLEVERQLKTPGNLKNSMEALERKILQQVEDMGQRQAIPGIAADGFTTDERKRKMMNDQIRFMLTAQPKELKGDTDIAKLGKALSVSVGSEGGFLMPEVFHSEIVRRLIKLGVVRPNSRVFTGVKKGNVPKQTGTVSWFKEGEKPTVPQTSDDPTFGNIPYATSKQKGLTKIPEELVNNEAFDILDFIADLFAEEGMRHEENEFTNGNGKGGPVGFRSTKNVTKISQDTSGAGNLDYDDFVNLKMALPSQYRADAKFMMNNDALTLTAKIKDGQQRPVFLDISLFNGQGTNATIPAQTVGMVLGLPILENEFIPSDIAGTDTEIWVANWRRFYYIFEEKGVEMRTTTEGFGTFEEDQVGIKFLTFIDGKGANEQAAKILDEVTL